MTLSARMEEAIRRRRCVEEGIRTEAHLDGVDEAIYSNYFDLGMIMDYWGPERLNHHIPRPPRRCSPPANAPA
ncbi:Purine catabolism protein PucG [Raoultella terrigena]|uniref:Purine catabolism protein PucG n=1 Tax=Raoultella terrigena TaxID=577 RepID=A0A3P8JZ28_RAOTE|nr:Purine catabolism protein PucG [Raoultella terrigena]